MRTSKVAAFVADDRFRNTILFVILANAILQGLQTSSTVMASAGDLIDFLDKVCLYIFVFEILLSIYASGLKFFKSGWNLCDILIIGISLFPAAESLTVLRALRILKLFRVVTVAPRLRRIVEGFIDSLPGMASVFLFLGVIFYIGAVIATKLFGGPCFNCTISQAEQFDLWFGTIGRSLYTLFQIMTLESWSMGIVRPILDVYPSAWLFFVPFILLTTFAVMNLLVGLIVNSMQDAHSEQANAETDAFRHDVLLKLQAIENELGKINK
jgi:voltage-gated sodium channel